MQKQFPSLLLSSPLFSCLLYCVTALSKIKRKKSNITCKTSLCLSLSLKCCFRISFRYFCCICFLFLSRFLFSSISPSNPWHLWLCWNPQRHSEIARRTENVMSKILDLISPEQPDHSSEIWNCCNLHYHQLSLRKSLDCQSEDRTKQQEIPIVLYSLALTVFWVIWPKF